MARSLTTVLTRRAVHRLADTGSLERGAEYAARGRVRGLVHDGETIVAEVTGSRRYRVRLWAEDGQIAHACTCPVGEEGLFCKHCVAVGLAWIAARTPAADARPSLPDLRAKLTAMPHEALVELLMEQAAVDDRLHRRLLLERAANPD
jgi:uncharacterized Zn finger protein